MTIKYAVQCLLSALRSCNSKRKARQSGEDFTYRNQSLPEQLEQVTVHSSRSVGGRSQEGTRLCEGVKFLLFYIEAQVNDSSEYYLTFARYLFLCARRADDRHQGLRGRWRHRFSRQESYFDQILFCGGPLDFWRQHPRIDWGQEKDTERLEQVNFEKRQICNPR